MLIADVIKFIQASKSKFFSIKFIKRTTGELREMSCQTGVKKYLAENPSRPGLNFKSHNLISVYDTVKKDYRSIPVEGIKEILVKGVWYNVEHPTKGVV